MRREIQGSRCITKGTPDALVYDDVMDKIGLADGLRYLDEGLPSGMARTFIVRGLLLLRTLENLQPKRFPTGKCFGDFNGIDISATLNGGLRSRARAARTPRRNHFENAGLFG